jgi:hypothetical protein
MAVPPGLPETRAETHLSLHNTRSPRRMPPEASSSSCALLSTRRILLAPHGGRSTNSCSEQDGLTKPMLGGLYYSYRRAA